MILDNGILHLELINNGGEMDRLVYKGQDILYRGDGQYWSGKNPTLFPFISSPKDKKYIYDGITYPCRNHGLIRYSTLDTIKDDGNIVSMRLTSSNETKKEYPFEFEYVISYKLDNNRVLISYTITNLDNRPMPFTFGLHPGFIVGDLNKMQLVFEDDEDGVFFDNTTRTSSIKKLGNYTNFLNDLATYQTVILKDLKSKYITLKNDKYSVKVDRTNFKYLALWSPDKNANFVCIEPWCSINDIGNSDNPFREDFELFSLKPNEVFNIDYSIEII